MMNTADSPNRAQEPHLGSGRMLTDRTVVVTGASSGIGAAIAVELAAAGADVVLHARSSRERLQGVARKIQTLGRETHLVLSDLSDREGQETLISQAWQWRNRIDAWVNNAGVDVLTGENADWTFDKKLEELWKVDVLATIHLAREVGQRMCEQGHGVIVNMGWDQVAVGMAGDSGQIFTATKGAVMAFTKSLAKSLAPKVRANCLAPGWIKTAWGEDASEDWQQRAQAESLLGRWGTPEDVARVARFLVSDDASFMTGQVVPINGGLCVS